LDLFRVFDWDGTSVGRGPGGPLFVARDRQGAGRHDAPAKYGAWYCSRVAVSAVAEAIKFLRGHRLEDEDLTRPDGTRRALAHFTLEHASRLVDLDDPRTLVARRLRPSEVATSRRAVTQHIAAALFDEDAAGLLWWSTLESSWINATLFAERVRADVVLVEHPTPLTTALPELRQAAEHLGIDV
jgi:hypothetical protein